MVSDIEQQRRTEVDQLNGEIIRLAKQRDMQAPISARIVELVKSMEGQANPAYLSPKDLRMRLGI